MIKLLPSVLVSMAVALASGNASAAEPVSMPILSTLVSLSVILALIGVLAFVAKRFGARGAPQARMLRVVSQISVGAREKISIVEVDDQWLVLGVTATQITLLTQTPRKENAAAISAAQPISFSKLLNIARGKHDAP